MALSIRIEGEHNRPEQKYAARARARGPGNAPTTPVVPSPISSSWDLDSSTISLAISWLTSCAGWGTEARAR